MSFILKWNILIKFLNMLLACAAPPAHSWLCCEQLSDDQSNNITGYESWQHKHISINTSCLENEHRAAMWATNQLTMPTSENYWHKEFLYCEISSFAIIILILVLKLFIVMSIIIVLMNAHILLCYRTLILHCTWSGDPAQY